MIYGRKQDHFMTKVSIKSKLMVNIANSPIKVSYFSSFVQTLLPSFCECTDAFVARLQPFSDGKTAVHMKRQIYVTSMNFISKVKNSLNIHMDCCNLIE